MFSYSINMYVQFVSQQCSLFTGVLSFEHIVIIAFCHSDRLLVSIDKNRHALEYGSKYIGLLMFLFSARYSHGQSVAKTAPAPMSRHTNNGLKFLFFANHCLIDSFI